MSTKIPEFMQSEERITTEEITKGDISGKMCLYFSQSGQRVTIKKRMIAGRNADIADIYLRPCFKTQNLAGISRRHFKISPNEDGTPTLVIQDLNSTNGTEVNGEPLPPRTPKILRHGSTVRLAKNDEFQFVVLDENKETTAIVDQPPKEEATKGRGKRPEPGISYDEVERQFLVDGRPIPDFRLPPLRQELLEYLYRNAEKVCTHDELVEEVWKGGEVTNAAIATAIRRLRRSLDKVSAGGGDYIKTAYRKGYQLSNKK